MIIKVNISIILNTFLNIFRNKLFFIIFKLSLKFNNNRYYDFYVTFKHSYNKYIIIVYIL